METIGLILGIVFFVLSIGLIITVKSLIKLIKYVIYARSTDSPGGKSITDEESQKIVDLAKDFAGNIAKVILKALTTKIDKNKKVKDVIEKIKNK